MIQILDNIKFKGSPKDRDYCNVEDVQELKGIELLAPNIAINILYTMVNELYNENKIIKGLCRDLTTLVLKTRPVNEVIETATDDYNVECMFSVADINTKVSNVTNFVATLYNMGSKPITVSSVRYMIKGDTTVYKGNDNVMIGSGEMRIILTTTHDFSLAGTKEVSLEYDIEGTTYTQIKTFKVK